MRYNIDGNPTRTYRTWNNMHRRCKDERSPAWKYYGARGIRVCERWSGRDGYDNFYTDMGPKPPGLTIGRINNDGDYEPGNCRWETWAEQAKNRRARKPVSDSLRNRCKLAGLPYLQVWLRIHRLGWDETRALNTPIGRRGRPLGWRKTTGSGARSSL